MSNKKNNKILMSKREKKKDNLEKLVEATQDILNNVYDLLDDAVSDFKEKEKMKDAVLYARVLNEMAEEMGQDKIDFMGMS